MIYIPDKCLQFFSVNSPNKLKLIRRSYYWGDDANLLNQMVIVRHNVSDIRYAKIYVYYRLKKEWLSDIPKAEFSANYQHVNGAKRNVWDYCQISSINSQSSIYTVKRHCTNNP